MDEQSFKISIFCIELGINTFKKMLIEFVFVVELF